MINLNIRRADFNELQLNEITKRPILDAIKVFWTKSEEEYVDFLKQNDIDFCKLEFSSITELKDVIDNDIKKLNEIAEQNPYDFDFKAVNLLKSKNLKSVNDSEFFKFTFDLREIEDSTIKDKIKNLFLQTKSASLIDFVEINEDSCSLLYHKRGAFYYNTSPFMPISRERISLLENYEVPKDNNFIVARFLLDFAHKLKENNINEAFCTTLYNGDKKIVDIEEIIFWGGLSQEDKEKQKTLLKEQQDINNEVKEIAKNEIKVENQTNRTSLKENEAHKVLENEKNVKLYNINSLETQNTSANTADLSSDDRIKEIVARSIEIYRQKEFEKTKIRLEKAQKDSISAYNDLKSYLNNGSSIVEAINNITQKYRNDDTVNFASLLFSQDILRLSSKEQEIATLNKNIDELKKECESTYNELAKKEETISKLRSTLTTKINETNNIKYETEQRYEELLKEKETNMNKILGNIKLEQEKIINEYENEIKDLDEKNEIIIDKNRDLEAANAALAQKELELQEKYNILAKENETNIKKLYKLEAQTEVFGQKENMYKEQIKFLEKQIEQVEVKKYQNINQEEHKSSSSQRSYDILGDVPTQKHK